MESLAANLLAATNSKTPTSSGSAFGTLIFLAVIGFAFYFFLIRPRSAAARRQRESLQDVTSGEEVMTTAGIFGTVVEVADDRVTIETAPGTRMTLLRSAIARRLTPPVEPAGEEWDEDESDQVPDPGDSYDELGHDHPTAHSEGADGAAGPGAASGNGHGQAVREPADPKEGEAGS